MNTPDILTCTSAEIYRWTESCENIDVQDDKGLTLLHAAVTYSRPHALEILLKADADVSIVDMNGANVFHHATRSYGKNSSSLRTVWLYIHSRQYEMKPQTPYEMLGSLDNYGDTPLHYAVRNRNIECCKYLLSNGVNPDIKNNLGSTPLHIAASKDFLDIARMLIQDRRVDVNSVALNGETPLLVSLQGWRTDGSVCAPLLKAGANPNVKSVSEYHNTTPLQYAITLGYFADCALLVEKGAIVDEKGYNPLHTLVIHHDNLPFFKYLVNKGANLHELTWNGDTILHLAACFHHTDLCKYLLKLGMNVNAKNNDGNTVLHEALRKYNMTLYLLLKSHGANIHALNNEGQTPLHIAGKVGASYATLHLVKAGVNLDARDNNGCTPLHLTLKVPSGCGTDASSRITMNPSYVKDRVEIMKNNEETDLHIAIRCTLFYTSAEINRSKMQEALDTSDVNAQNIWGNTALHIAAMLERTKECRFLVENGADLSLQNKNGYTAWDVIRSGTQEESDLRDMMKVE
jgi:ankyrin repeat protein